MGETPGEANWQEDGVQLSGCLVTGSQHLSCSRNGSWGCDHTCRQRSQPGFLEGKDRSPGFLEVVLGTPGIKESDGGILDLGLRLEGPS